VHNTGAIFCGYHDADGQLHYAGGVSAGFRQEQLREEVYRRLAPLERKTSPLTTKATDLPPRPHWAEPKLVAEVRFGEWTRIRTFAIRPSSDCGTTRSRDVVLDQHATRPSAPRKVRFSNP
jgi:bifunctional non-homologous end joining protein LigD